MPEEIIIRARAVELIRAQARRSKIIRIAALIGTGAAVGFSVAVLFLQQA